jgi:hypothetical protein
LLTRWLSAGETLRAWNAVLTAGRGLAPGVMRGGDDLMQIKGAAVAVSYIGISNRRS